MPRRYLQFTKDSYYHIYNRGFERQSIFREECNYHYLLDLLMQVAGECEISVIAYCLLPNHYHWLLRQDGDTPVGEVPKRVFGSYSQAFNKAYKRRGTLFDQRYQAILVDSDVYLYRLCCYIHCNPVKHGLVAQPEEWPYSNYTHWIAGPQNTSEQQFVRDQFTNPVMYEALVHTYLASGSYDTTDEAAKNTKDQQRRSNELPEAPRTR